ncbi:hypothetical protein [Flagellimonas allohymeniacidonis]|uniref:Uncharacterized protein n=1 Tax=Flagellimonas allohymeniacidonis TaxID=2517819 RepID=A0A4Q8QKV7_9FLAO|nr:hypothetical protein [Allomuricauda hymeniacidonis]TAI48876.1 hypothetical protein EW142_03505 [Allomuricauda hymeniacidonis]
MKTSFTLYKKGLAVSVDVFVHNKKICIRTNSNSGEHLTHIANDSEADLLKALEAKSWLKRLFSPKKQENLSAKHRILELMAEKFTTVDKDPTPEIDAFLKHHQIQHSNSYWPDSDRF